MVSEQRVVRELGVDVLVLLGGLQLARCDKNRMRGESWKGERNKKRQETQPAECRRQRASQPAGQ